MNSYSHMYLAAEKLKKEGNNFKAIPGCLLAGQPIVTSEGIKSVENIKVGDLVLTHKGRYRKVLSTMTREHTGLLYSVFLAQDKNPLYLTDEHPILVRDRKGNQNWKKPGEIPFGRPSKIVGLNAWNSWAMLPKLEETITSISVPAFLGNDFVWTSENKCVRKLLPNKYYNATKEWFLPKNLDLTEKFCRFLGFYAAEGWANPDGTFGFTFHRKEVDYQNFVVDELAKLHISANIRDRGELKNSCDINGCSKPFANLLIALFGKGAKNKKIPLEIMLSSTRAKHAFISGLIDGDGKAKTKTNLQRNLKVGSPHLAWGFRTLLVSVGFWSRVAHGTDKKGFDFWMVSFSPERKWKKTISDSLGTYKPIRMIHSTQVENVPVFNFEVEEDNSYVSDFVLHNCEAYFLPSLKDWAALKEQRAQEKLAEKKKKETPETDAQQQLELIGDPLASTKQELDAITGVSEEEESGTVVENEEESKSSKVKDPLYQRSHLVLLPKNSQGLKALFRLVSRSYIDGFYRFPRMDFEMLKQEAQGNLVATSACIAGYPAKVIFDFQKEPDWTKWQPSQESFEEIQTKLKESIEKFKWALGEENYYLEIQFNKLGAQHLVNYHLIEAAKRTNTKLVATADAHYADPNHWREREIYKLMAWMNKTKGDLDVSKIPQKIEDLKCELYPKNAQQMWDSYKHYSEGYDFYDDQLVCEAIERTWHIAHEQIGEIKPDKTVKLPVLEKLVSKEENTRLLKEFPEASEDDLAFKELIRLAKTGLIKKNKHGNQIYVDRLKHELSVIKELKFAKYFLTYAKIIEVCSKETLVGFGRGSAGGSLLAYCLEITGLDPIRFGTLFERFLVRGKKGYPDIDTDFGDRELATKLIADYFGEQNVLSVSNFSQLQVASLIKDLAKVYSVPFEEVNAYTHKMRNEAMSEAKKEPGFDAQVWQFTVEVAEKDSPSFREFMTKMEKYPDFANALKILFKQMRNVSRHAGGLIVSHNPCDNMPIIKSGGKLQTPWPEGLNFRHLEEFGFLKFDILGLGTLRMFEECIKKIIKKERKIKHVPFSEVREWFWKNCHPDNNNLSDLKVYENVYWNNKYAGVFQFAKKNVQNFMAEMKPACITDIAIATSLHRPGPLGIQAEKQYLENRLNPHQIKYKHPLLKEVLADTSGLIVFQEQLQLIYHKLAGVPLEDTDAVRKAFTKKDISNREKATKDREVMREDFAEKCLAVNQIKKRVSYEIFDEMEKFVAYSFNRSHGIVYGITSYICAWFLTYYPDEWITTYIDYSATEKGKVAGKEDPKVIALNEAKALGYCVGKPDINLSTNEYILNGKKLVPSFASLKYVGTTVVREIDDYRPYNTLEDLLWTKNLLHTVWRHSKFNKRALSTLVKMEAFDSLGLVGPDKTFKNYRQMYEVLVEKGDTFKKALSRKKNRNHEELLVQAIKDVQDLPDWTTEEKLKFQGELSGSVDLSLICTPEIENFLTKNDIYGIENWESENQNYWAIVQNAVITQARTGRKYLKMTLMGSDGSTHTCNVWSFGNTLEENEKIKKHSIIIAPFQKNDFGLSTNLRKVYRVKEDKDNNVAKAINDYED